MLLTSHSPVVVRGSQPFFRAHAAPRRRRPRRPSPGRRRSGPSAPGCTPGRPRSAPSRPRTPPQQRQLVGGGGLGQPPQQPSPPAVWVSPSRSLRRVEPVGAADRPSTAPSRRRCRCARSSRCAYACSCAVSCRPASCAWSSSAARMSDLDDARRVVRAGRRTPALAPESRCRARPRDTPRRRHGHRRQPCSACQQRVAVHGGAAVPPRPLRPRPTRLQRRRRRGRRRRRRYGGPAPAAPGPSRTRSRPPRPRARPRERQRDDSSGRRRPDGRRAARRLWRTPCPRCSGRRLCVSLDARLDACQATLRNL